jgi:hypothetical protein
MCPPRLMRVAIGAALGEEIRGQAFYSKSSFLPSVFHRLSSVFCQQFSARRVNQRKSVPDSLSALCVLCGRNLSGSGSLAPPSQR